MKPKTARNFVRILAAVALMLTTLVPAAFAAGPGEPTQTALVCYPTAVTRSEDGSEVKKMYDLSPTDDPAGIPRQISSRTVTTITPMWTLVLQRLRWIGWLRSSTG